MHPHADLNRIFPIDDEASARFAISKAACLRAAGVISPAERDAVLFRAATALERAGARAATEPAENPSVRLRDAGVGHRTSG